MFETWQKTAEFFSCALVLPRRAVGVRIIETQADFEALPTAPPKRPINFCHMVAGATKGKAFKAASEDFLCRSGSRVLGIDPSDPKNANGQNWARLGLYDGLELSAEVRASLSYSQNPAYGVLVAPIDQFEEAPDVVIVVANPFNCMRIVQGYAYHFGMPKSVNMIGNQAFCLECTARPFVVDDMNVSLLCIGTRHRSGWKDDEMAVAIPKSQFANVVDGIARTIDPMESDANKARIQERLKEAGIDFSIRFHWNYYMEA